MPSHSVCRIDETTVVREIQSAQKRVVFVAPGVSKPIADAIGVAFRRLGTGRVSAILDMDPEVYRLGYGTQEGLAALQKTTMQAGELLGHQPGVRICVLVCDDRTWVYSPTPLLVEDDSPRDGHPNGIQLAATPETLANDLGIGSSGIAARSLGLDPVKTTDIESVQVDLTHNPPVKFDLARKVRVFNAQLEFIEFELQGCFVSRRTAEVSADLIGLVGDAATRERLRSTFKVLDKGDIVDEKAELSEKTLQDLRKKIADTYLTSLKGYGVVMLRSNKAAFEKEVAELRKLVDQFKEKLEASLDALISANAGKLAELLFASVKDNWPPRWIRVLGHNPSEQQLKACLKDEILRAFGTAKDIGGAMKVKCVPKGVTYEMLTDPEFLKLAQTAFPQLQLMDEYDAAPEAST